MKPVASRRALVSATATLLAAITSGGPPIAAEAGVPLQLSSLPAGSRIRESLEMSLRPKVRALPRRPLQMDFAVMLMRTGYAVTDDLDFIAMNSESQPHAERERPVPHLRAVASFSHLQNDTI